MIYVILALTVVVIALLIWIRSLHRGQDWLLAYARAHGHTDMLTAITSADEREGREMVQRLCDADKHDHAPLEDLAWGRVSAGDALTLAKRPALYNGGVKRRKRERPTKGSVQGRGPAPTTPPPPSSRVRDLQQRMHTTPEQAARATEEMGHQTQAALRRHVDGDLRR